MSFERQQQKGAPLTLFAPMSHHILAKPAIFLVAVAIIAACSKSGTSASSAPTPSSGAAARVANATPSAVTPASIALGDSIFHARGCRNCHGPDAKGRANGPDLTSGHFKHVDGSYDDFVRLITSGVPVSAIKDSTHKRAMPARGGSPTPLTDDQIKAVAAFVWSLNHK
ncbi:MAG: c-type cytochrome [Gemmatimonadaceae bacterium]